MAKTARGIHQPSSGPRPAERLPYDPVEWERRLAEARTLREKALQGGVPPRRGAADSPPPSMVDRIRGFASIRSRRLGAPPAWAGAVAVALVAGFLAGASFDRLAGPGSSGAVADAAGPEAPSTDTTTQVLALANPAIDLPDAPEPPPERAELPPPRAAAEEARWADASTQAPAAPDLADPPAADAADAAPTAAPEAQDDDAPTAPDPVTEDRPEADESDARELSENARVIVLAPRSVPADVREETVALLRDGDWPADGARTSPYTIRATHVRFYHEADRAAAEQLAALVEGAARDFTSYSPSPDEGLLELWLAGQAPARSAPSRQPPDPAQALVNFLNRLAGAN